MRVLRYVLMGFVMAACGIAMAQPRALDDADLGGISGGEGISFQIELFVNASRDNSNTADPANTLAGGSVPLSNLSNCTGTGNPCTFALQYANRNGSATPCTANNVACAGNANGQWVVAHDYFMGLRVPELDLDGGALSTASSNSAYWDPSKFQSPAGTCLLTQLSAGACPTTLSGASLTTFNGLNALIFNMAPLGTLGITHGTPGVTEQSSGYNSLSLGLNIGRMAVEYGTPSTNNGYLPASDSGKSFLGLVIGDTWSDKQAINRGATAPVTGGCTAASGTGCTVPTYANVLSMAGVAITGKAYVFGY